MLITVVSPISRLLLASVKSKKKRNWWRGNLLICCGKFNKDPPFVRVHGEGLKLGAVKNGTEER